MTHKGVVTHINESTNEVTFYFEDYSVIHKLKQLVGIAIALTTKRWKEDRSIAQNNFLWACIKDISRVTQNPNRWEIYLELLKKHGDFTHILVKPESVEKFSKEWRTVENLGEKRTEAGEVAIQLRCYYGTHLYSVDEMARFLTCVVEEMKTLNIKPKLSKEEMERYGLNN